MKGISCGDCKYWIADRRQFLDDEDEYGASLPVGECRRFPPSIILRDGGGDTPSFTETEFPLTVFDRGCGEYCASERKIEPNALIVGKYYIFRHSEFSSGSWVHSGRVEETPDGVRLADYDSGWSAPEYYDPSECWGFMELEEFSCFDDWKTVPPHIRWEKQMMADMK